FFKYVSCQPFMDGMKFYIDNNMVGLYSNTSDTNFRRVAFPVMAGPHTFKWIYSKDASISANRDAAWTDFIVFPPQYKTTVSAGANAEICENSTYQLHGLADSYDSLHWSTTGTGTFSNPAILDPIYTPSTQDIGAGSVQLTLAAFGQNGIDTTNTMTLTITKAPVAAAGGNQAICTGSIFPVSGSSASNWVSLLWATRGDGSFDHTNTLHPVYTPGPQDKTHGSVRLVLTAASTTCPVAADSLLLTIHGLPQVDLGKDTLACANKVIALNATTPNASSYLWLPSNKTTATINVDSTGIGLHSAKISVIVTDNNGCAGKDSVTVSFKVCGGIDELTGVSLQIFPNPNNGLFTIEIKSQQPQKVDVTIINQSGVAVYTLSSLNVNGILSEKLNLSQLAQGTYLVQISNISGKMTRKLVIQK
ncbi:MAG: T9SS type A sorting domain-containing protein, partial [Mariniphaga sp.]